MAERDGYYRVLERCQKGDGDITGWLVWFLECFERAVEHSEILISTVLTKARFWQQHGQTLLNERQRKVVNRLLDAGPDGFEGGLTTRKYVSMAKVSRATAFRKPLSSLNLPFAPLRETNLSKRRLPCCVVFQH